jgi:hypothetical protein
MSVASSTPRWRWRVDELDDRRNRAFKLRMRWFAAAVIILVLIALDRAYMDGQNAALLMSLAQRAAAAINQWADDLMRLIRR